MALFEEAAVAALREVFSLPGFRPGQLDAVSATVSGQDSLVILPTGGGKSVCFQLPCHLRPYGFTVVVCPLIALAKDQVDRCEERGIYAERWNCEVAESRKASIIKDMTSDEPSLRLLYITPEGLRHPKLLESLKEAAAKNNLVSFAVDEAHTVSEWGHDFRPAYLELSCLKQEFPSVPIAALTASCTSKVSDDIISVLRLRSPRIVKGSFNRPNIAYQVRYKELIGDGSDAAALEDLIEFIAARPDECGIIYARLRATCDWLASELASRDYDVGCYHAGKSTEARARVQRDWSSGGINVVVATIAFGMGIDRADVRWVVHWNAPNSMEGFYQESGRVGRDGLPSLSIMYASHADLQAAHKMERGSRTGAVAEVAGYAHGACCRRKRVLNFFGEDRGTCKGSADELCDYCTDPKAIQKALSQLERREAEQGSKAAAVRARMMGIRVEPDVEEGDGGASDSEPAGSSRSARAQGVSWGSATTYSASVVSGSAQQQLRAARVPRVDGGTDNTLALAAPCAAHDSAAVGSSGGGINRPPAIKRPLSACGPAPTSAFATAATEQQRFLPGAGAETSGGEPADNRARVLPQHSHSSCSDGGPGGLAGQPAAQGPHDSSQAPEGSAPAQARQPQLKRLKPHLPFKAPARTTAPQPNLPVRGQQDDCRAEVEPDTHTDGTREVDAAAPCHTASRRPIDAVTSVKGVSTVAAPLRDDSSGKSLVGPQLLKRRLPFKPPVRINSLS